MPRKTIEMNDVPKQPRFFEPLETRRMFASVGVNNGVLTIVGNPGPDLVVVSAGPNGSVDVRLNGANSNHTGASSISAELLGGDDVIEIRTGLNLPARIDAGTENDTLTGGDGNDELIGGPGNDFLEGRGGNDWLDGGAGRDTMHGNDAVDTVDYSSRTGDLVITLDRNGNDGEANERDDVSDSVENVICGSGNDRVTGSLTAGSAANLNNRFWGNAGNDTLDGSAGNDTLDGGDNADSLVGGAGADYLDGWTGNDTLEGGDGNDSLLGWTGNDLLRGGANNDWIVGEQDNDTLEGDAGNDAMGGHDGNDVLRGGDGLDTMYGDGGNDTLDGGNDADVIEGGAGNDTADYSARTHNLAISLDGVANDGRAGSQLFYYDPFTGQGWGDPGERDNVKGDIETVLGGSGNDAISSPAATVVNNRFVGNGGNDSLTGGGGNDSLEGGANNDNLFGGDGNDSITGGEGHDNIGGDNGVDTLRGEGGDDTLWARDNGTADVVDGGIGNDRAKVDPNDTLTSIESFFEWLFIWP
jgi:Ca2+-binding RTX toxin-like protein